MAPYQPAMPAGAMATMAGPWLHARRRFTTATTDAEPRSAPDQGSRCLLRPVTVAVIWILSESAAGTVVVYSLYGGREPLITFKVEIEQEEDGRWLAEVVELPGVLAYGETEQAALSRVQALALRVIAERLEHGEAGPNLLSISFNAA
jgi:predicted RNase H-like HicB family nuclease